MIAMEFSYFPFDGSEYKPQMGLKPLELKNWIEVDSNYSHYVARKKELLQNHPETVFIFRDEADLIALELYDTVKEHLQNYFPNLVQFGDKPATGKEAFFQLSHWTQEDWAILSPEAPVKLIAGSVCFPSRWSLQEKMNQQSGFIHTPVPGFSNIAKPAENFLERIPVDRAAWRLNWTIHDSDELFCPTPHPPQSGIDESNVLAKTFLRIERQTLRRLPNTKGVVFSIRTYIHRMQDVVAAPDQRVQVLNTLRSLDDATIRYKGMASFYESLTTSLEKV
jgi:dimethylamine monooxygenase subunit A